MKVWRQAFNFFCLVLLVAAPAAAQDPVSDLKNLIHPHPSEAAGASGHSPTRHRKKHHHVKTEDAEASPSPKRKHSAKPSPKPEDADSSEKRKPAEKASPTPSPAEATPSPNPIPSAPNASLKPDAISGFEAQPPRVQQLLESALSLTEQNLGYTYGSADPKNGGMDCSGFIYYVLSQAGFKDAPRDSSGQYLWVRKNSNFQAVISRNPETFELKDLRPGDLMFWSGTYKVDREVPITHVMIYLGKEKSTGKPVMVGATDGRTYDGVRRTGVSVFDFKLPSGVPNKNGPDLVAKFEGYGSIPGLRTDSPEMPASTPKPVPSPTPQGTPLTNGD